MTEIELGGTVGVDPSADWRAASARGAFETAARLADVAALGTVDPPSDVERDTLSFLTTVTKDLRTKAWRDVLAWCASQPEGSDDLTPGGSFAAAVDEARVLAESGALVDVRSVDEAVALLDTLPDEPAIFPAERLAQRGTAQVLLGSSDEARRLLGQAVELDPGHVRARVNLGNVLLEGGELDAAVGSYRRALEIDADDPHALHNLGVALRRQGKIGESVAALRKAQKAEQKKSSRPMRRRGAAGGGGSGSNRPTPTVLGVPRSWVVTGLIVGALWWIFLR